MKEQLNSPIDWKAPENKAPEHAHRYKDQLEHLATLRPDLGTQPTDVPQVPGLTPKEATRFRNWALYTRTHNLNEILGNYQIVVTPRKLNNK